MLKEVRVKLEGDPSTKMETAAIKLPFDTRDVWGKARAPVKVVVNAATRKGAGVKAGDIVSVTLELDAEKRDVEIPTELKNGLGANLALKLDALAFTHKKEFVQWYTGAKKEETRARRLQKMKQMLTSGQVIS